MLNAAELKALLRTEGLRLTKRLGQHYLVDARVIERVVDACRLTSRDTVVEIGPGLGALTGRLAHHAGKVIAVEIDRKVADVLRQRLSGCANVSVVCQDILAFDWAAVDSAIGPRPSAGGHQVVVVGAIPYHITSPILVSLSWHRRLIDRAVLIVQREVAQRLTATPGTKSYGRLSLLAQYGWDVEPILTIARHAFFPQPRVDSCALRFVAPRRPAVAVADEPLFFELVKAAFGQRRKTLANGLASQPALGISRSQAQALLRVLGLSSTVRGEALSLEQFAHLANAVHDMRQSGKGLH